MDDNISFFHSFRNTLDAPRDQWKITPDYKGLGVGGQSDGFYVWNNFDKAKEYLSLNGSNKNCLICEVSVPKKDIKHPNWQIDYEALGRPQDTFETETNELKNNLASLFLKYQKDVPNYEEDLKNGEYGFSITSYHQNKYDTLIKITPTNSSKKTCLYEGDLATSGYEQALNDYMCANSSGYFQEYNELMLQSLDCFHSALKYTGKETLNVRNNYEMERDEKNNIKIKKSNNTKIQDIRNRLNQIQAEEKAPYKPVDRSKIDFSKMILDKTNKER